MRHDSADIFQTLRDAALIQQTGGGNGFSFSRLRPKGTMVLTSAGQATGPVGFLRVYDHAFGEIAQDIFNDAIDLHACQRMFAANADTGQPLIRTFLLGGQFTASWLFFG